MAKFDYKKWIIENKYGKLNEQAGSALVKIRNCGGSSTYNTCLPNASYYALGHQFKYSSPFGTRTGFLQSIVQQGCGNTPNINILEDPYLGACANNNLSGSIDTTGTTGPATTTISPATGSVTGSGAVTGSVTGSSPTSTITCYACAYEASDIADGAPYTPAATIEIEFSGASINSAGGCAPTGMGNAYMFTQLSAQLVANGITPATLPNQGAGVGDYNMLASYHGIPLNGHWSAFVGQTGCPGIGPNAPTGSASPATGDFTDYGIGGGIQFDYPSNWSVTGWTNDFVDMMLAHPNPCNFLNQRYAQFGEMLQQGNMGPLQTNLTYQKFAVVHTLLELTGCGLPNPNPFTSLLQEQINEIKLDPAAKELLAKREREIKNKIRIKGSEKGMKFNKDLERRRRRAPRRKAPRRRGRKRRNENQINTLKKLIKKTLSEIQMLDPKAGGTGQFCAIDGDGIKGPLPECSTCAKGCGEFCICIGESGYPKSNIAMAVDGSMGELVRTSESKFMIFKRFKRF